MILKAIIRTLFVEVSLYSIFSKLWTNFNLGWGSREIHLSELTEGMRLSRIVGYGEDFFSEYFNCVIGKLSPLGPDCARLRFRYSGRNDISTIDGSIKYLTTSTGHVSTPISLSSNSGLESGWEFYV